MKYCSECGGSTSRQRLEANDRERLVCLTCTTVRYENPRVIVGCIVYIGKKLLMCRRAQEPAKGQWTIPIGFLECGETLQQGAARETYEETGVIVDPNDLDLSFVMNITAIDQIVIAFRIDIGVTPELRSGIECFEVAFLTESEIRERELAWKTALGSVTDTFFRELRARVFSIQLITPEATPDNKSKSRDYGIRDRMDFIEK